MLRLGTAGWGAHRIVVSAGIWALRWLHCTGFDDERGDYVLLMHDHVSYRYEVIMVLGKGSFGQVYTPIRAIA